MKKLLTLLTLSAFLFLSATPALAHGGGNSGSGGGHHGRRGDVT